MQVLLISGEEMGEIEYMLKSEMEKILIDLEDNEVDYIVKKALKERYNKLFKLFKRITSHKECSNYTLENILCSF